MKKYYHVFKRKIKKLVSNLKKQVPIYIPVLQSDLLKDRTALITGGTRGIGFAIAKAFLESGASVIITGHQEDRLKKACTLLLGNNIEKYQGRVIGFILDNSDIKTFNSKFDEVLQSLGNKKIDILVNNAGIIKNSDFETINEQDFTEVIDLNLKGTYFLSKIVAQYMKINGIKGNILNIASSSSLRPAISPYTISKWGIRGFTIGLAKTLIPYGIIVNGLAPGPTATALIKDDDYEGIEHISNPSGRYATSEEIANMAVILTSGIGKMIVGDIVYMTGGAGIVTFDDMKY